MSLWKGFKRQKHLTADVRYQRHYEYFADGGSQALPTGGRTVVSLFKIENGQRIHVSTGSADCSIKDNFCKATGRDIALQRAIDAYVDSENRRRFEKTLGRAIAVAGLMV